MLSGKIRELRTAHGMNQVELAKSLSVTKQTVSNWENNNIQPSIDMLVKIADFFGVTTDYLLDRDNSMVIKANGLTLTQIAHINMLIKDLKEKCPAEQQDI